MAETLAIRLDGKSSSGEELASVRIGFFEESSPSDSVHTAAMNSTGGDDWKPYFSYSSGTFTCIKACNCILSGWVSMYATASYTAGKGALFVNGTSRQTYTTPTKTSGSTSAKYGVLHKFEVGDNFYFRTPSNDGYPKQWGELFKLSDSEYDKYAAMVVSPASITVSGYAMVSSTSTVKTI